MKRIEDLFIDIQAEDGFELWNGEVATSRISAPLGTDLSVWIEREIVEEEIINTNEYDIPDNELSIKIQ